MLFDEISTHVCVSVCVCACLHASVYIFVCVSVYTFVCVSVYIFVCVSVYVCIFILLIFFRDLPPDRREKLLVSLDTDGDGKVNLAEFRQLFDRK